MINFFMPMIPPTTTHQQKKVNFKTNHFYEDANLKAARSKLMAHLGKHVPKAPLKGPVKLLVKWCFPITGKHKNGEYKTTKPDTDNLQKLLKDCMTDCGYWKDDALVACEICEKFYSEIPGIYIEYEVLSQCDEKEEE